MKSLGIDLGGDTGFALWNEVALQCWSQNMTRRNESTGMRYIRLQACLSETYGACPFQVIFYEEVQRHAATWAAHAYGGYLATVQTWCQQNTVECTGLAVGRVKKFGTGKGNANKQMMVDAAVKRFGAELVEDDHNRADALWTLACGMAEEVGIPLA